MNIIPVTHVSSKGYGFGRCFLVEAQSLEASPEKISPDQVEAEREKINLALAKSQKELELLSQDSHIFKAHLELTQDPALLSLLEEELLALSSSELALQNATHALCDMFAQVDDSYLKERITDVKDVSKRIMSHLKGVSLDLFSSISEESILFAQDFTPTDTAHMNFQLVKGLVTEKGGVTSHVSIIARQKKVPAVVGVSSLFSYVKQGDFVVLDGVEGNIYVNPDEITLNKLKSMAEEQKQREERLQELRDLPTVTLDGHKVELFANIGNASDVIAALEQGAEGVGLFRTELLYMDSPDFPSEETQFLQYKSAVEQGNFPTIIRTLDIGGDKSLPYFQFEPEENPFLGYRAIRMCLDLKEKVFKPQLRALLRASAFGDIRIMYPMIISLEEYVSANQVLEECKEELRQAQVAFNEKIQTGIMIETPSAVLLSKVLAKEVDFFSIGTNDLTQYLLCVDRGNEKISHLYNSFHPAVLTAIATVIENAHAHGKLVGVCGEFAADPSAISLLLGMGLDEFSMSSSLILESREQIRQSSYQKSKDFLSQVLKQTTLEEVRALLH